MGRPLLKRIAEKVLGDEYANIIWKRIEIIGDIALIRKPFDLPADLLRAIGEELLRELPYIKSVWLATSPVHGVERVRDLVHLAGEKKGETIYKEHGCIFMLDITKVYVSPVLGYDHIRVARQVKEGEKVLNMFAGFCPYSIIISKHARPSYVVSIDINEYAARYARTNIELNKVAHINEVVHGDSLLITPTLGDKFDRVLMPYPDLFDESIRVAVTAVKDGSYIHPHLFVDASDKKSALIRACSIVLEKLSDMGMSAEIRGGHVIRSVAPRRYHVTVDVIIHKNLQP